MSYVVVATLQQIAAVPTNAGNVSSEPKLFDAAVARLGCYRETWF